MKTQRKWKLIQNKKHWDNWLAKKASEKRGRRNPILQKCEEYIEGEGEEEALGEDKLVQG